MADKPRPPLTAAQRREKRRRWRTLRDVLMFQGKILVEGLKDIVLIPVSIAAAVVDVINASRRPDRYLDRLMHLGKRFEQWLDLYNVADDRLLPDTSDDDVDDISVDDKRGANRKR